MAGLYRFEVWRLLTCFMFMGKLGFPFLLNMIYFYRQSSTLESQTFERRTSDYLFMILFGALLLLPIGLYFQFYLLGQGIMLMVTYYWSRMNPNVMISFFGIPFKGRYLPWVLVALNFLMGGMPIVQLCGIFVGHIYFFFVDVLPETQGVRYVRTPWFLFRLFPPELNSNSPDFANARAVYPGNQNARYRDLGPGRRF
eukprot:CAMPEP_0119155392 /NCGR_PEP_ID=MMETSP1310-20130426/51719_1 /TAXON_ID=464262 /ORGANISM="Genus nov. species nov., Strain RCC2339" /LENGTH=197 /DNA_ID=CAMNT_0007147989 /DNA_START=264 /DNA_END=857 /DNA_ORIENTATION=+